MSEKYPVNIRDIIVEIENLKAGASMEGIVAMNAALAQCMIAGELLEVRLQLSEVNANLEEINDKLIDVASAAAAD